MDKFEQYFKENRLRLDTGELENREWERIEESFSCYNRRRNLRQFYAAAIILTFIAVGTLIWVTQLKQLAGSDRTAVLNGVANYYMQEEISSINLINGAEDAIRKQSIPVEFEEMFTGFIKQLDVIDKQYEIYKTEISEHGYNQEIIQQVIYNYQMKLSVLQMLHSEINKINSRTKNNENENRKIKLHI
jgi:hypothetical protein